MSGLGEGLSRNGIGFSVWAGSVLVRAGSVTSFIEGFRLDLGQKCMKIEKKETGERPGLVLSLVKK